MGHGAKKWRMTLRLSALSGFLGAKVCFFGNSQAVQKLKKQVKTRSSFLKKRTKKLLLRFARSFQSHWPKMIKVFLLLFVHKKKFFLFFACFLR